MTLLGRHVQRRRKELGLTLAQLSERTGLLPQTINAIERGASKRPRYDTLRLLAKALDEPIEDFATEAYAEAESIPA